MPSADKRISGLSGNAVQIQSVDVSTTAPTANQILKYNSGLNEYVPELDATSDNATSLRGVDIAAAAGTPLVDNILKYDPSSGSSGEWILAADTAGTDAQSIQSEPVDATTPTTGQVLKYTGVSGTPTGKWEPGADSTDTNATQLQGRTLVSTAPNDGDAIKWNANAPGGSGPGEWQPHPDNNSTNATAIQNRPVDASAPAVNQTLVWDNSTPPGEWKVSYDPGLYIAGRAVSSAIPGGNNIIYWNGITSEWEFMLPPGIVSDGVRSYLLTAGENLGVGTGAAGALAGKIHAYNTGAGVDTKVVVESDDGHTALHLRSNSGGSAVAGDRYAQLQFWNDGASKAQLHYDPEDLELVYAPDGSANSGKGMAIKSDGRTGFHLNERISNFTVKAVADTDPAVGLMQPVPNEATPVLATPTGTTLAATTTPAGFLKSIGVGDKLCLASVPGTYATVLDVVDDNTLTLDATLTGTAQKIGIQRALASFIDRSNDTEFIITDDGKVGIGEPNPSRRLHVKTETGEGNSTIIVESPDDQAILSLRSDQTGVASGTNKDPSINFQSGTGPGEEARIRYYMDYEQVGIVLQDSPVVNDKVTFSKSDTLPIGTSRGVRVGIRQERSASGLSAKGLPTGQLMGSDDLAVTATPDATRLIHTLSANGDPMQRIAIGDRVAIATTEPLADADYAYVSIVGTTYFETSTPIGAVGVANNVWLKPAHFRLEDATTTQDVLVVDSEKRMRVGSFQEGLDADLNVNGTVALTDAGAQTVPAGANLAHVYYRAPALGNDEHCKLLLHFDEDVPHGGAWADSAWGSTFPHIVTANGVTIDKTGPGSGPGSGPKFGDGSARFDGFSVLKVDELLGSRGEFYPGSAGFTFTAWLYLPASPANYTQPLWGAYGTASNWQNIVYDQTTDALSCYANTGGGKTLNWSVPTLGMVHSQWHYLMIAYEAAPSNRVFVFVDGTLINSGGTLMAGTWSTLFETSSINIGYDQGDSNQMFQGWMDELSWSSTSRQSASFVSPTEPFYAEGLYVYHSGKSTPFRLKPTGS